MAEIRPCRRPIMACSNRSTRPWTIFSRKSPKRKAKHAIPPRGRPNANRAPKETTGGVERIEAQVRLQFPERTGNGTTRGANGRGHAAEYTHGQSKENAHPKKIKGDLEGEGQVGKGLKIHGTGGQAVEGQNGEAANEAANERNQEGFNEKGEDDVPGVEAQRAHGGNFTAAFGDGGIHSVEGAKDRADGHDQCDEPA